VAALDRDIADLRERLSHVCWPSVETVADALQGGPLARVHPRAVQARVVPRQDIAALGLTS
jgi:hypothetical protein